MWLHEMKLVEWIAQEELVLNRRIRSIEQTAFSNAEFEYLGWCKGYASCLRHVKDKIEVER